MWQVFTRIPMLLAKIVVKSVPLLRNTRVAAMAQTADNAPPAHLLRDRPPAEALRHQGTGFALLACGARCSLDFSRR